MTKEGVIEPLPIKTQAVSSGSEATVMILKIDDMIAAGEEEMPSPKEMGGGPGGMPGGM